MLDTETDVGMKFFCILPSHRASSVILKKKRKSAGGIKKTKLLCMICFSLLGDVPDCEPAALAQHHIKFFVP